MSGYKYDTVSEQPPAPGGRLFFAAILLVGLATIAFTLTFQQAMKPNQTPSPLVAKPAPAIKVEGWLNGPGPTEDELRGKVIVLDAWAFWCDPCRAAAPELIALERKYRDRGVVFLGLTSEGERQLAKSRRFIEATGITWPNGYGAVETLQALNADFIPQMWVIDRQNRITWDVSSNEPIESALDRALAETP
ncbi:MAG: TlpA disulfide reductase family protein [Planctomycetota bacterium]